MIALRLLHFAQKVMLSGGFFYFVVFGALYKTFHIAV